LVPVHSFEVVVPDVILV